MSNTGKSTQIGALLAEIIRKRNWRRRIGLHQVFDFWEEIVEKDAAAMSRPFLIRGTVLWVNVSDSAWMQQLHFQKADLLDRINSRLADEEITDIRFKLDMSLGRPENEKHQISENRKTFAPDREQTRKFEAMFASLKDEELRGTIKRLWRKFKEIR
ncbi:MAG: DUF721 domain-containing protein [Thermodesulfobacteriota bacterium]|nr:DUF721 domain-containing protein [Thermodesulfobacteriota bacterium]